MKTIKNLGYLIITFLGYWPVSWTLRIRGEAPQFSIVRPVRMAVLGNKYIFLERNGDLDITHRVILSKGVYIRNTKDVKLYFIRRPGENKKIVSVNYNHTSVYSKLTISERILFTVYRIFN